MINAPKSRPAVETLAILSLLVAACSAADPSTAAQTAAAATLDAKLQAVQAAVDLETAQAENSALETSVAKLATENADLMKMGTQTAIAQSTSAAVTPQLISPIGAACRTGPDGSFGTVLNLQPGQAYEILGRSVNGEWWQVIPPEGEAGTCWAFWDSSFQFLGQAFNLPLLSGPTTPTRTPAPTHPPGISIRLEKIISCGGGSTASIAVVNRGPETYQSGTVIIFDENGNEVRRKGGNTVFLPSRVCPGGELPTLEPGQERFMAISTSGIADGDEFSVLVQVCTERAHGGNCVKARRTFVH
jgi:hypothetical protein